MMHEALVTGIIAGESRLSAVLGSSFVRLPRQNQYDSNAVDEEN